MGEPLRIGVVGCGNISDRYLGTLTALPETTVVAVTDLDPAKAAATADRHGVTAVTPDAFDELPEVEWVLNLTTPRQHLDVATRAVRNGRSVYNEKPLCVSYAEARTLLAAADDAGVRVACAPDTVLGTGVQSARKVIDDGRIGRPVGASATMAVPGHERWHPNPDFYYAEGGGPLLDMGPYYLSALVTLLGPVAAVTGLGSRSRTERTIGSGSRAGETIPVTVDTHVTALLRHAGGALTTLVVSFDTAATRSANIEVHGEKGSLVVPDPNGFGGEPLLHPVGGGWQPVAECAGYRDAERGCGLADIARSADRATARAGSELALHVLDVMECILTSAAGEGMPVTTRTGCTVPEPVPLTALDTRAPR
ncbi:Gfo/Idh/MocA family oxidoreductase [Actinoplanes sp. NPDC051851]|uniref:Gfo/Idh/MocA family protein n=1 Tax=Actinoplanes sp. NPDC051851 TaxID=3154753 RepID=UPI003434A02F